MGLPLLELPTFSPADCLACYPAGKTPGRFYATFAEIKAGWAWDPTWDPPPNRTFEILQVPHLHNCVWEYIGLNWGCSYTTTLAGPPLPGSQIGLTCVLPGVAWGFKGVIRPQCKYSFENQIQNPIPNVYYGGYCWIWQL